MTRGLMKSSFIALSMAAGLATANAADLGGNCCADLEERVAELEATVAKKGTRKVSLTVYGWVNKMMMHWDDGVQNNNYLGIDNTNSATRFGFRGDAAINSEWKAGYSILLDVNSGALSATVNQLREETNPGCSTSNAACTPGAAWRNDHSVRMRDANFWLESSRLGRMTMGRLTVPGPQNIIDLGGISMVANGSQSLVGGSFFFRDATGALGNRAIGDVTDNLADFSNRVDGIRWDSPTWHGFVVGAAIGEARDVQRPNNGLTSTDPTFAGHSEGPLGRLWAVNLRYAGEFNGVRVASAIGYEVSSSEETMGSATFDRPNSKNFGLSGSLLHTATGLFAQYQWTRYDRGNNDGGTDTAKNWLVQGGVTRNWFGIGNTALYAELSQVKNGNNAFASATVTNNLSASDYRMWGLGMTQNIDAAAMQLYAGYRNHSLEFANGNVMKDIGIFIAGARINF